MGTPAASHSARLGPMRAPWHLAAARFGGGSGTTYFACDLGHLLLCSFTNTDYATQEIEQLKRRARWLLLAHGRWRTGEKLGVLVPSPMRS